MLKKYILGAVKNALKKSAKTMLADEGISKEAKVALKKFANSKVDDTVAVAINRAKTVSSTELKKYLASELNLNNNEINKLVRGFKQTKNMRDISVGTEFKNVARKAFKTKIDTTPTDSIKKITRKVQEFNAKPKTNDNDEKNYNSAVKSSLNDLEAEVKSKLEGYSVDKNKVNLNVELLKMLDDNKNYKKSTLIALEVISKNITSDLDYYQQGSGGEPLIIFNEETKQYDVVFKDSVLKSVEAIKDDVKYALSL